MEQARLEFTDASGQPQVVEVVETPFSIGRSHGSHLVLPGTEVSRAHAEIIWDGQQFLLRDCQSRAGTFVNNERTGQRVLTAQVQELTEGSTTHTVRLSGRATRCSSCKIPSSARSSARCAVTPWMFVNVQLQYNSSDDALITNVRIR